MPIKEVPYALPPKRFTDPEPLPADFRYEAKEYILESKCTSFVVRLHWCVYVQVSAIDLMGRSSRCRAADE